jgi:hypothetical protein
LITKPQSSNRKEGEEEEEEICSSRGKGRRRRRSRNYWPSNINLLMDYAKEKNSSKAAITLHITQSFNLSLDKNGMDKKVNPRKKNQRV